MYTLADRDYDGYSFDVGMLQHFVLGSLDPFCTRSIFTLFTSLSFFIILCEVQPLHDMYLERCCFPNMNLFLSRRGGGCHIFTKATFIEYKLLVQHIFIIVPEQ